MLEKAISLNKNSIVIILSVNIINVLIPWRQNQDENYRLIWVVIYVKNQQYKLRNILEPLSVAHHSVHPSGQVKCI